MYMYMYINVYVEKLEGDLDQEGLRQLVLKDKYRCS